MSAQIKEYPMIFSSESIKAILNGSKTQSRRVIKPQPKEHWQRGMPFIYKGNILSKQEMLSLCPYGQVGDRLWVRETHYRYGFWSKEPKVIGKRQSYHFVPMDEEKFPVRYADNPPDTIYKQSEKYALGYFKRPSMFMPKIASRITLEITELRAERLQKISVEDIRREGIHDLGPIPVKTAMLITGTDNLDDLQMELARAEFASLWDSLNAKHGYGWDFNPWVFPIGFRKMEVEQ